MISPFTRMVMKILPDKAVVALGRKLINRYMSKYANIKINGFENIDKTEGTKIFICNHLSNTDGLILSNMLKEKYDPVFVAGVKLEGDAITNIGMNMVRHISIKAGTADKEAITNIVKTVKEGENLLIYPEGTRSRTRALIKARRGILLIARLTKATIVPIGINGSDKLLPIAEDGDMGGEEWHHADVTVNVGEGFKLPEREDGEGKHEYDDRCMQYLMRKIAVLLPEEYRGFYK